MSTDDSRQQGPGPHPDADRSEPVDETVVQPRPGPRPTAEEEHEAYADGRHVDTSSDAPASTGSTAASSGAVTSGAASTAAMPPVPPRPSERPVTDPNGPGTTFFTNHPDDVVAREKDAYGGFHVGSAFFGWLVAVGLLGLLLGLIGVVTAVVGVGAVGDVGLDAGASTVGIVLAVSVLLALFLAYLGGGYVAGRMARFDGLKQGLAVWLWALAVSVLLAVLGLVVGDQLDVPNRLDTLGLPADATEMGVAGAITAGVVLLVTLAGALAGGAAGTRYHRKVDRVGLLSEPEPVRR